MVISKEDTVVNEITNVLLFFFKYSCENVYFSDTAIRGAARARRQLAIEKCNELGKLVDNWDNKDVPQCCNEFIKGM